MMWRETLLAVALATCGAGLVAGQDLQTSLKALAAKAREAAKATPNTLNVDQARAELQKAIDQFNAFLHKSPDRQKIARWQQYVQWEDLKAAAKGVQPSSESAVDDVVAKMHAENGAKRRMEYVTKLRAEYDPRIDAENNAEMLAKHLAEYDAKMLAYDAKIRAENDSLVRPQLLLIRDAITSYATISDAAANRELSVEYPKRLEELAKQLEALADEATGTDAAVGLGVNVGWLESHQQAPELVSEIRQTFGKPNFLGYMSREFAAVGVERDINQLNAVHDNINGTSMHGTARLVGRTSLSFNENPSIASANILLGGTAWSNNVGYNGPVTIYSTGATSISGRKTVWMDVLGMHEYRAQAACRTSSNINGIHAKHRIVENIAWKRAGQQKGSSEAVASQHASARVAGQMDVEAGKLIRERNDDYLNKFRYPLLRKGEFPDDMAFSTTRDRAHVQMRQESDDMLAAPSDPPDFSNDHAVGTRTHESAVINFGRVTLGGKYLDDRQIEEIIRDDLKGEVPEDMRVTLPNRKLDPEKDPWAMTFADDRPLNVKFRKSAMAPNSDELWIAIRLKEVYRGQRTIGGPYSRISQEIIEVSAAYEIVPIASAPDRLNLHRKGDIAVRFLSRPNPDQRLVSRGDTVVVPLLTRKFRNLFKENIGDEGFELKGNLAKAGRLWITEASSNLGWLRMGLEPKPDGAATTAAAGGE